MHCHDRDLMKLTNPIIRCLLGINIIHLLCRRHVSLIYFCILQRLCVKLVFFRTDGKVPIPKFKIHAKQKQTWIFFRPWCVCTCVCVCVYIFTNPSTWVGYDTRSIFKRSLTGFNSEFSFSKAEEPSLPYYLPIAGGRIIGFIPFPRILVLCEMLSVSSRIWTRVAMSISYDDNHWTKGTCVYVCIQISCLTHSYRLKLIKILTARYLIL